MMYVEGDISLDAMQQSFIRTSTLLVYIHAILSVSQFTVRSCRFINYKILFPYFAHIYVNDKGKLLDKAFLTTH